MEDIQSVMKLQEILMTSHNHYQDGLTNLKVRTIIAFGGLGIYLFAKKKWWN